MDPRNAPHPRPAGRPHPRRAAGRMEAAIYDAARACTGSGCLCAEAQADGVPCPTLGLDCASCGRASPAVLTAGLPSPADRWLLVRSGVA